MGDTPETAPSILTGLRRGLMCRCPVCGEGQLFAGFLRVAPRCPVCGADNTIYPADDFPPYLTILAVGHIVVPLFMWSDRALAPSVWVQTAIWVPVTALLCLVLLPFMKGATVGLCWATGMRREPRG
jgi:uncharacterized protein (DUF983 family)